ncbi:PQQ-binding-like beta-propeller repeat protein [Gracilimonas sediminicola]|uniref:PQQ-binding-like beta-propeller repeat protein n=1 Tax=Gracilimonas sediminicola TaxID=2952158 RepID=A0A9X2REW7_9BACT|nr:PQQ-binding-like beta-propeller repeat protein [Gracilimonas sediminicola]MCP9292255.1 PQQ-binding-like beta-propeller repeat protein [Gracilimonas sediminicola]
MKALELVIILFFISSCFGENPAKIEEKDVELKILWEKDTNIIDSPSAQPLIIDDSVIVFTGEVSIRAVRVSDGEMKWSGEVDGENALNTKVLLYTDDRIVSAHKNKVLGWDVRIGEKILEINKQDQVSVFSRGRNSVVDNGFALIGDTLDAYIFDSSGKTRFNIDVDFGSLALGYANKNVYLGQSKTINGALTLGKLRAFDSQSGDSLWVYTTENGGFNESIFIEDKILFASTFGNSPKNEAVALDAETGELIWRFESDYIFTRNSALGPLHYYVNTGGSLAALDKQTGQLKWREEWLGTASTKPVYLEGYVYFTDYSEIKVINDETGEVVHREPTPDGTAIWHVAASSNKIFAQTSRQLIAYEPWHLRSD